MKFEHGNTRESQDIVDLEFHERDANMKEGMQPPDDSEVAKMDDIFEKSTFTLLEKEDVSSEKLITLGNVLELAPGALNELSYTAIASLTGAIDVMESGQIVRDILLEEIDYFKKVADTDVLTGISSRRSIERRLDMEWSRSHRQSRSLSVLMIDIDGLKSINDVHGHQIGDVVITEVARRLASSLREEDGIGRIGGDEFLVVCPDTDARSIKLVGRKLTKVLSAAPIETLWATLPVTISVGCATVLEETLSTAALIGKADTEMYCDKRKNSRQNTR